MTPFSTEYHRHSPSQKQEQTNEKQTLSFSRSKTGR